MAYNISRLSKKSPEQGKSYFLDANVWIYILDTSTNPKHKEYINFFNDLIASIDDFNSKKEQSIKDGGSVPGLYDDSQKPRIILTPLLISEMFNVLLKSRFHEWKDNNQSSSNPHPEFKKDFRETKEYTDSVKYLRSELYQYEDYFEVVNDDTSAIDIKNLFDNWNYDMDFNDQCYYYLCFEKGYVLITNDGDFYINDVEIYTELNYLLKLVNS